MNDAGDFPPTDEETPAHTDPGPGVVKQVENLIRRHPMMAALATVGFGCAVGVAARELLGHRRRRPEAACCSFWRIFKADSLNLQNPRMIAPAILQTMESVP